MSIQKKSKIKSLSLYILGASSWLIAIILVTHAYSFAQSLIQSYSSTAQLNQGVIVQVTPNNSGYVEPVTNNNVGKSYGVVVNNSEAQLSLSSTAGSSNKLQTFVATQGHYNVLVTDQNGSISPGDYITVSAIDGVGMKAASTNPIVVAQATGSFNGSGAILGTDKVKYSNGSEQTVQIGLIEANINVERNPFAQNNQDYLPSFLRKSAQTVVGLGKPISIWRVYIGVVIVLIAAVMAAVILYSGIRSSIISIGRNPLSKKAITKGLLQVIITSLIILILGVFGVYLLLKV